MPELIGKKIIIKNVLPDIIKNEIQILKKIGAKITAKKNLTIIKSKNLKKLMSPQNHTQVFTDLQAQLMVLMTQSKEYPKLKKIFLKIDLCMCLS